MTIKWVKSDPLVMNGEPFCYGSRMTVRQLLEERRHGYDLTRILTDHPELKRLGVASAWAYAAAHPERYAEFVGRRRLAGRARLHGAEAATLPEQLRIPGVVVDRGRPCRPDRCVPDRAGPPDRVRPRRGHFRPGW